MAEDQLKKSNDILEKELLYDFCAMGKMQEKMHQLLSKIT